MILGSFWWTFLAVVVATAVGLSVIVVSGVVSFYLGRDLYSWARPRLLARHRRRRLLRESRRLRRAELTSEDFDDWCAVVDDEPDA